MELVGLRLTMPAEKLKQENDKLRALMTKNDRKWIEITERLQALVAERTVAERTVAEQMPTKLMTKIQLETTIGEHICLNGPDAYDCFDELYSVFRDHFAAKELK